MSLSFQSIPKDSFPVWLLLLVPAVMISCNTGESRDAPSATAPEIVQIQPLEISADPIPVYLSGKLSTRQEFDLSFGTGGFIEELNAEEGDEVRQGDTLATLNRTEINAQVVRVQNMVEKYRRDLQRIQNLYEDNAATREQVDDLTTALENARAELDIALFHQERSVITAPANGRLLARYAEKNEQINPGEPIFRLGENGPNSFILKAGISDRHVTRLQRGDSASVYLDAFPGRSFTGSVTKIGAAAHKRSGVFPLEITLDDPAKELRNGFVARALVYPSDQNPYITVPIDALVEADDKYVYIYVPDEALQSAQRLRVKPVHIGNTHFSVAVDDLPDHSNVITRGAAYLRPGSPITLAGEGF